METTQAKTSCRFKVSSSAEAGDKFGGFEF
jgi:hypothetical protein